MNKKQLIVAWVIRLKWYIFCLILILITYISVQAIVKKSENLGEETYPNEPNGFRGIKWGTDISSLEGMKHLYDVQKAYGVKISEYEREGDELYVEGVDVIHIHYGFWKGKLSCVYIGILGESNYKDFESICSSRFGEGKIDEKGIWWGDEASHKWIGDKTVIILSRKLFDDCRMYSSKFYDFLEYHIAQMAKIYKAKREEELQKSKEESEKRGKGW